VYQDKQFSLEELKFIKIKIMSIGNLKNSGNQGNNFPWQLKVLKGLQEIANQTSLPLTCVEDSIALCAGGNLLTSTTIGADIGLDVNIIGGVTLEVNLDAADDQVGIYGYVNGASGSPVPLNVNATGQVAIQDGGNSITVDGTVDLGATTLTALENITVQNPGGASAVNIQDGGNSITVDGTVTANAGTGNFTVVQTTASNLNATVVGGTGISRTPTILRTSTSSSIAAGAYSMSFASVGTANATVGAGLTILKPGETINFDAGAINNTLGAVAYDSSAVGAELLIITLT
jgi:hypothetical protein